MESLLPIIVFIIFMALQALASRKPKKTFPEQDMPEQVERDGTSEDALKELREILFGDSAPAPRPTPPPIPRPAPAPKPAPIPQRPKARTPITGSIQPSKKSLFKQQEPDRREDRPVEILEQEAKPELHPMLVRLQNPETVRDVVVMSEILQRRRPV